MGKAFAGVVMGLLAAFVASIVFGIAAGGGSTAANGWGGGIGFAAALLFALFAERTRYAWGRGLLLVGLLCFALPVASVVGSMIVGAEAYGRATGEVQRAGTAIGTFVGGGLVAIVSGVVGFFLGMIFLVGAYFALRRA